MSVEYLICPHCGSVCGEFETVIGEHAPQGGDIALCCHCAGVSIHVSPTLARKPDEFEAQSFLEDEAIVSARAEILMELMMGATDA